MSRQSRFKLKRPHSPDILGLHNYKKQRLIEDFENLSLNDGPRRSKASAFPKALKDIDVISIPKEVQKHAERLRSSGEYTHEQLIYEKVREAMRNEAMQVVEWYDPQNVAYLQWREWTQSRWAVWPAQSYYYGYDSDVDMDT
ncbi:YPL071C [Zygosaccharomyces parabailii]|nr:YPL071C [Zygosaccharomyces parabailii]CDH09416.1 uncharacterized protein ZBAI_01200 [Zygosaccharomyces bailii ISA1307]